MYGKGMSYLNLRIKSSPESVNGESRGMDENKRGSSQVGHDGTGLAMTGTGLSHDATITATRTPKPKNDKSVNNFESFMYHAHSSYARTSNYVEENIILAHYHD